MALTEKTKEKIPGSGTDHFAYTEDLTGNINISQRQKSYDPISYGADNTGVADSRTAFANVLTAIATAGTNETMAVTTGTYKLSSNLTIPSNVTIDIQPGAKFSIDSGRVLTIVGGLNAGVHQIFSGLGTVSFAGNTKIKEVYPEWWGTAGDGITDDKDAINAMFATVQTGGGNHIRFSVGRTYKVIGEVHISDNTHIQGKGAKIYVPLFVSGETNQWTNTGAYGSNITVEGIEFYGEGTKLGAENFSWAFRGTFKNILIKDCIFRNLGRDGAEFIGAASDYCVVKDCLIYDCAGNGIAVTDGDNFIFTGNKIYDTGLPCINLETNEAADTVTNVLIYGNICSGADAYGIECVRTGIGSKVIITGNTITGCKYIGIEAKVSSGLIISDNISHTNGWSGMRVECDKAIISNNEVYNNGQDIVGGGTAVGIVLAGNYNYTLVGNRMFDNQGSPTQTSKRYFATGCIETNCLILDEEDFFHPGDAWIAGALDVTGNAVIDGSVAIGTTIDATKKATIYGDVKVYDASEAGDELVSNGDFETSSDDVLPSGWTNSGLTNFLTCADAGAFHAGAKGVEVFGNATTQYGYQDINAFGGSVYNFSAWIKASTGDPARVQVYDTTAAASLYDSGSQSGTTYHQLTSTFTVAGSGVHVLHIRLYCTEASASRWYADDISLKEAKGGDLAVLGAITTNALNLQGAFNHDGTTAGFFSAAPVVQQTGFAALKTNYTTGDLDSEAEIISAMNTQNTALNAIRTALNALGWTTTV